MIGILNYGAGNVQSVVRAFDFLRVPCVAGNSPQDLAHCEKIVLPGVGDAAFAMKQLKKSGFDSFLRDRFFSEKPILGICLGAQIIFEFCEEGETEGLGFLKGSVKHFKNIFLQEKSAQFLQSMQNENLKIPHIGWNDLKIQNGGEKIFQAILKKSFGKKNFSNDFYFVHSYVICAKENSIVKALSNYGVDFPSCVSQKNLTVFQFHPEKSGMAGLALLKDFADGKF